MKKDICLVGLLETQNGRQNAASEKPELLEPCFYTSGSELNSI
jgi:hypothetical protein